MDRGSESICGILATAMPIPKRITWVTTDVYGTLIDWESGVLDAFKAAAQEDDQTIDKNGILEPFKAIQHKIESGSYELYAEVLRRTAVQIANDGGWQLESSRAGFLPASIPSWKPFREANPALNKIGKKYKTGLVSNIDDKLLGFTRRHIPLEVDLVVTAQQVRAYKPDPAHFKEFARRIGGKKGWVHIGSGYLTDVEPCLKMKVPVIWVNRNKETLEKGQRKPDAEVPNLKAALTLLGID